jgi:hypothetical protein
MTKTGLNLGCGMLNLGEHLLNVDIRRTPLVDVVMDLNHRPWAFTNEVFEEVYALDILEHVDDPFLFMEEVWRVSKPYARIHIRMPNFAHPQAFRAMDHKRFGHSESLDVLIPGTPYFEGYSYYSFARFRKLDFHPYGAELVWVLEKDILDNGSWEAPNGRDA